MRKRALVAALVAVSLSLCSCREEGAQNPASTAAQPETTIEHRASEEIERLKEENTKLLAEVVALRQQVEELSLTPEVLLSRVEVALASDKLDEARQSSDMLHQRFSGSVQAKTAKSAITKYEAQIAARAAHAKAIEEQGFYALKPNRAPVIKGVTVQVESLQLGKRWQFDTYDNRWHYRDAERGDRFVLMRATLKSVDKSPDLPDIGVYRIDGRKMIRLAQMKYEFRRWSSHGTFIGLYHDYKNDFAHTSAVPFNAAASISVEDAMKPFAVVATGELCHRRGSQIGQPEVTYRLQYDCPAKATIDAEDFTTGNYRVLAFFNSPKRK